MSGRLHTTIGVIVTLAITAVFYWEEDAVGVLGTVLIAYAVSAIIHDAVCAARRRSERILGGPR